MHQSPVIKIMKLRPLAVMPRGNQDGDACLDLSFAPADGQAIVLNSGYTLKFGTGLAMEIPPGWEGLIRSRSGLAAKNDVFVLNSPGTIDSCYRGEIIVILHKALTKPLNFAPSLTIKPGDRIAQICFKPVHAPTLVEVDELSSSERGNQGLGSSGV